MKKIFSFQTRPQRALLILAAVYALLTALYPLFNHPRETTYCLSTALDEGIPFSGVWILPYVSWYLFLPGVVLLLGLKDKRQCALTLLTMIAGQLLSYLTYSLFQTTVPRPAIPGTDLFSRLVQLIYSIDQPYNAFPSLHVLITYALMLGAARAEGLTKAARAAVWIMGGAIILSTVFVKQHVVADLLGGMVLAQVVHLLLTHFLGPRLSAQWQKTS
ncbi:MAG: phosphatase PAP2 family protein [Bacillota bacterium]|jgi:membrane-associated phospholipid phosphatase|nr:phosphatase PAP2 family protein [Bacillota bacterium]HPZ23006.1 phosphatase PAP2 family protein [Bacillota bacterium]HQD19908.1 phosphatase PAP2 family protein [Bacillota bacterium]